MGSGESRSSLPPSRFANLSIEGEIAFRLSRGILADNLEDEKLAQCIECWFSVIELHNNVFRGDESHESRIGCLQSNARWLGTALKVVSIILTGSPGRLISLNGSRAVTVICEDQRIDLFVEQNICCS